MGMKIKNGAFSYCTYIRYAKLSENIDIINPFTFLHCYSLEKVIMPQNIKFIGKEAFRGCHMLRELIFLNAENTDPTAFQDTPLENGFRKL